MGRYADIRTGTLGVLLAMLGACAPAGPQARRPQPQVPPPPPPAEEPTRSGPLRVGVILPETAPANLREYGDLVRQGVDIAFRDRADIELVIRDDGGDPDTSARLARDLEAEDVIAILGPLLGEGVDRAAGARSDTRLAIVSPTASEQPVGPNAYSLNAGDDRGGEALARYATSRSVGEVALLYPVGEEFVGQVERFRRELEARGGRIVTEVTWTPGTTTFQQTIERVRRARPGAVFIAAGERDIRQLAPQLAYYGLAGVQILGTEAWASEDVLARLDPGQVEGVVAAVPFIATSRDVAWDEFVGLYEAAQRRSLDNPYPALGWDAARLVLAAIGDDRPSRAEVARRLAEIQDFRGATGILSLVEGTVTRRPFLVRVRNGRAEPIPDFER